MAERDRLARKNRTKPSRRPAGRRPWDLARYAFFIFLAALVPVLIASSSKAGQLSASQDWAIGAISFAFALMLVLSTTLARHLMRNLLAGIRNRQNRLG